MPSDAFEVDRDFAFLGRTFEEYRRMFDLDAREVTGRSILDCPGGPGSFTAVASTFATVTAVDPVYGPSATELERRCETAVRLTVDQLREKRDLFVWDVYGDVETRAQFLRSAFRRFLSDYALYPGRYVPGALPDLPVETNAFDLVLSANFLFLYDDRLDREFHLDAALDLARVAREEVRIFPLHGLDREPSEYVEPTVQGLQNRGLGVERYEVSYEFQPGATEMLTVGGCGTIGDES